MSPSENIAIVQRFVEDLWNRRDLESADELFTPDCLTHQLRSGAPLSSVPRGPQAIKAHVAEWLQGFPDLHFDIEQVIADGDRVVSQLLLKGSHQDTWSGNPSYRSARSNSDDHHPSHREREDR